MKGSELLDLNELLISKYSLSIFAVMYLRIGDKTERRKANINLVFAKRRIIYLKELNISY